MFHGLFREYFVRCRFLFQRISCVEFYLYKSDNVSFSNIFMHQDKVTIRNYPDFLKKYLFTDIIFFGDVTHRD